MDLYQSSRSGGSSNRPYSQQPQTAGGFRYTPNGQLTNGPSLFGNTTNLNTIFGSGIPPVFSSSSAVGGNQFNFPLRSNRAAVGNISTNSNRTHSQLSGGNHNHNYGVYSKPTTSGSNSGFEQQYYSGSSTGSNGYNNITRSIGKQRKSQGQGNGGSQVMRAVTASFGRSSLDEVPVQVEGNSDSSPEPQYRIIKRGDSYSGINAAASDSGNQLSNGENSAPGNVTSGSAQKPPNGNATISELESDFSGGATPTATSPHTNGPSSSRAVLNNPQHKRTPVGEVAEIARFHGVTAEYRLISEVGPPHCPTFTVVLHLGGEMYEGIGPSIKKAQLVAATVALEKTTLTKPPPRNNTPRRNFQSWQGQNRTQNLPLVQLSALAEEMNEPLHFVNHPVMAVNPFRKVTPVTRVAVHVGNRIFSGEGNTFSAAKSMGVMVALKALMKVRNEREEVHRAQTGMDHNEIQEEDESKSPISVVYEMAFKRNMVISYEIMKEVGPAHMKVFTVQCKVGEEFTTESDGFTKQQAKKLASELMITKLKEIPVPGENTFKAFHRGLLTPKITKRKAVAPVLKDIQKMSVSPISRLIQIAHLRKYKEPEFTVIVSSSAEDADEAEVVPQPQLRPNRRNPRLKKPHFVIEVKVGPYVSRGEGPNKKAAKKAAADSALVLLGYLPSETKESPKAEPQAAGTTIKPGISAETPSSSKSAPNILKIISGRQIVPGILVVRNQESSASSSEFKTGAERPPPNILSKVEEGKPFPPKASPAAPIVLEAVNKLSYLAQLLGVQVSYSDFPKKSEYLSVVSLGTTPPHVSHGIGPTLDEARNNAAMQVLAELSDKGIENDPQSPDSPKENHEIAPDSK